MANLIYPTFKNAALTTGTGVNLSSDTIKVTLVDAASYTYSAAHDFIDDVPGGARISTQTLAGKTVTTNVFDADDVTFTTVASGTYEALVIWEDTGTESTSRLIAYIDTATGLPVTSTGGNATVTWDNGANKIFAL